MMAPGDGVSVFSYFARERKFLALTAVTGIIYNMGMAAAPWFEGQLAQYLFDVLGGSRAAVDLVMLSVAYVLVIGVVQAMRALKRLYVRKFANNVSRSMKESIYHHLVHESYAEVQREDPGAIMTRAIADAEACAEGMRKFTTEIFDTGILMAAYLAELLVLDWRLALAVMAFPPIAYVVAGALKERVSEASSASKEAMSRLNDAAVDSVGHALTYRIYGEDGRRARAYEGVLCDYERKNVAAGIWQNSPQPVYLAISMAGVIPVLYLGGANVLGAGWAAWDIATFSTFLSCFTKLATKSSHAAKLFNAVQKAEVSWERIKGYLVAGKEETSPRPVARPAVLRMDAVSCAYDGGETGGAKAFCLRDLNLVARPGEIVGITGRVASGKSTFGRLFLGELPHGGTISYGGRDVASCEETIFAYVGHDPELFTGSVRENVALAEGGMMDEDRLAHVLSEVRIDGEVSADSSVGMEGDELSGGQQARIALARALYSRAPVLILDDPFAAVDMRTEARIFEALREDEGWRTVLIISHRLELFPQMDRVVFLEGGTMASGTHAQLMADDGYRSLFELQGQVTGGEDHAQE